MNREESKQHIRNLINSCIKRQHKINDNLFYLYYNKSYLRALKFSKINGKPVNKNNFKEGVTLFGISVKNKHFWDLPIIRNYLEEIYSIKYSERKELFEEVINEYEQYEGYKFW